MERWMNWMRKSPGIIPLVIIRSWREERTACPIIVNGSCSVSN